MKQLIVKCLLIAVISFAAVQQSHAQRIYVTVQPSARAVERPVAPAPDYIWVEGEWLPQGRTYIYKPGYWIAPRQHYVWAPGHWIRMRRGWYWEKGYWRRA